MDGYAALRTRVDRFLRDNPEVQLVTLKRPKPAQRRTYANANDECYGRMPETCDRVKQILRQHLPADEGMKLTRSDGSEIALDDLREQIFDQIYAEITSKFRAALSEVCEQKHTLLVRMRSHQKQLVSWLEEGYTDIPEAVEAPRVRSRRERATEVDVEIEDDDDFGL